MVAKYTVLMSADNALKAIGSVAERLRGSNTQEWLARRTGLSQGTISLIESGSTNPTLETLNRVANGAGYVMELVFRDPTGEGAPVATPKARLQFDYDLVSMENEVLRQNLRKKDREIARQRALIQIARRTLEEHAGSLDIGELEATIYALTKLLMGCGDES